MKLASAGRMVISADHELAPASARDRRVKERIDEKLSKTHYSARKGVWFRGCKAYQTVAAAMAAGRLA